MSMPATDLERFLLRELEGFKRELTMFPDDDTVWKTVPGVTNSAANLALHVAGNLQHFVGAVLGGTSYVRNRELEFDRRSGTRREIVAELDAAAAAVRAVIPTLTAERMDQPFPELLNGLRIRTGLFLHHLSVHAGFHLAQAGYLRRVITGDATSSGPIPLDALV
jgi:DinB superfamily